VSTGLIVNGDDAAERGALAGSWVSAAQVGVPTNLEDKLGIPAAVWSTQKKCWLDGERRPLTRLSTSTF
jgi:hypothetical protein